MDSDSIMHQLQTQVATLQEQVAQSVQANQALQAQVNQANQAVAATNHAVANMGQNVPNNTQLRTGKPEKFNGQNVRSWLKSLDNIFGTQNPSYMTGAGLEWWELVTLNGTTITD